VSPHAVVQAIRRRAGGNFLPFVLAAGASVPVNIGARIALSHWTRYEFAVLLAHGVGMLTAFILSRVFVFEASGRSVASELGRFALVNVVSAAVTWCVSVGLLYRVFPWVGFRYEPELVAHLIGLAASAVTSFIGHSRFSFRRAS
jgi:putative flippase GtrA